MVAYTVGRGIWKDSYAFFPGPTEADDLVARVGPRDVTTLVLCPPGGHAQALLRHPRLLSHRRGLTLWIRLDSALDDIFRAMDSTARRQIRRAEKVSGLRVVRNEQRLVRDFLSLYARMASHKAAVRALRHGHLRAMLPVCDVFGIYHGDVLLAAHVSLLDRKLGYVRLLHSVSLRFGVDHEIARDAGDANRLLHYSEMAAWKKEGFLVYDFCGLGTGSRDLESIARFKRSFGGQELEQLVVTFSGWLGRCRVALARCRRSLKCTDGE